MVTSTHSSKHTPLAQGSHLSLRIEGGENACCSPPPTDNSCRTRDSNPQPQVTSPTLYPLGHDCPFERGFLYMWCSGVAYAMPRFIRLVKSSLALLSILPHVQYIHTEN